MEMLVFSLVKDRDLVFFNAIIVFYHPGTNVQKTLPLISLFNLNG